MRVLPGGKDDPRTRLGVGPHVGWSRVEERLVHGSSVGIGSVSSEMRHSSAWHRSSNPSCWLPAGLMRSSSRQPRSRAWSTAGNQRGHHGLDSRYRPGRTEQFI